MKHGVTGGETTAASLLPPSFFARRVHFGCSRCGACCNSNPQMSLPELFRHQETFIGCLTIRRLQHALDGTDVLIASQAYNDPLAETCSALAQDKLCSLQDRGKPLACRSVPLEATLPDAFQLSVLQERARDARFMGADCIQPRAELDSVVEHLPVIVDGPRVVDPEARRALELRRAALRQDRATWGDRVFHMLRADLFEHPGVLTLPQQGYLCMSLAPALSVISAISNALTRRVVEYLNAQIELIAFTLGAPVKEPTQAQRELASMLRASVSLRARLQAARPLPQPAPNASAVEAWLAGQDAEAVGG